MGRRAFVIVLDSLGVGSLPDAHAFGDAGAHTLDHTLGAVGGGGIALPRLEAWGLGCVEGVASLGQPGRPQASFGRLAEVSAGKDTSSGHWEMMGAPVSDAFTTFPDGFPDDLIAAFCEVAGVDGVLGNEPASGTEIIERLGAEHAAAGLPIVYTSADSVFQIAAHTDVVPLDTLYGWCRAARALLDERRVARVIARPFVGEPGAYVRTYDRRDFSMEPPAATVLDALVAGGVDVVGVGKIGDIYAGRGVPRCIHTEGNRDGMAAVRGLAEEVDDGLVFANLVDFDMLWGHRRDPAGYAGGLSDFDDDLAALEAGGLREGDLVILTGDHGNDPTWRGTDHTREYVPVLAHIAGQDEGRDLGTRPTFADLGATVFEALGGGMWDGPGSSFLEELTK